MHQSQSQPYQKVASYEAKQPIKRCVLLYSGGLDTSVMLKWIKETYHCEVVTLTVNLGQQADDFSAIEAKAHALGAVSVHTVDARAKFATEYLEPAILANAHYQGEYHLSTPLGRPLLAKLAVELAHQVGADAIAHGATGKGNDQLRIEGAILALDSTMKIIAPVREWRMDRIEEIHYAEANGIPVPASIDFPYSVDDNMWGMTWEGGLIEDPQAIAPTDQFLNKVAADQPPLNITIQFEHGVPIALNGETIALYELINRLNVIGRSRGIGITEQIEDRVIGVKNRGIYDQPAAHIIITAHQALERAVSTRMLNQLKEQQDLAWGNLCYAGAWFDPAMTALNAFNQSVNQWVSGTVTLELAGQSVRVIAIKSATQLAHSSFNQAEGFALNEQASAPFIEIATLQTRLAYQRKAQP